MRAFGREQIQIRRDDCALSSGKAVGCLYVTVVVARQALRNAEIVIDRIFYALHE